MIRRPVHSAVVQTVPRIRNHGNPAPAFPALCSRHRVTAHRNLACGKIQIAPFQRVRFALAHPAVGQTFHEISAITREAPMPVAHLLNHRVELLAARQRNLFRPQLRAFYRGRRICVDHAGFNCHRKHMPEQGNGVVVICRRRNPAIPARPRLAIAGRDPADFGPGKIRPALFKRTQTLAIVGACPRFDLHVVVQIPQMTCRRFTKRHLRRDPGILPAATVADALPMVLQKLSQPRLGHAEMRRLERLPNLFALAENPRVIPPRLVPDQIVLPRLSPNLRPAERICTL